MKRIVPIIVTDDRVTDLFIEQWQNEPQESGHCLADGPTAVPSDGQLAQDLDLITQEMVGSSGTWPFPGEREAAARIRSAFQLDEEDAA